MTASDPGAASGPGIVVVTDIGLDVHVDGDTDGGIDVRDDIVDGGIIVHVDTGRLDKTTPLYERVGLAAAHAAHKRSLQQQIEVRP